MGLPTGTNSTINDIVKCISRGEYRIPKFQRDFVWDIKKSAALMDSVFRGYPISSIILWKTKTELNEIRKIGGIDIPNRDTGRYTSYIIDGQQRMTSLYFALNGLKTSSGSDFSKMCVSLLANKTEQLVYEEIPKDGNPDDFVMLKDLYSTKGLVGANHDRRIELYQILLQYNISVIEIDDEYLGLEEVIEIFERLNLGGKKLNLFSIIAARSYKEPKSNSPGFDLAKQFDEFNKKLVSKNYGTINDAVFLQAISACLIGKVNKSDILRNLQSELIIENYANIEKAISSAIEHLKGDYYGAHVANLLPYQRMLVPFAYFHFKIGSKQISTLQEQYLRDFFWRCVIGKRYNSSADTNLNSDITKIQNILENSVPTQEPIVLSPKSIIENGRFMLSSAFVMGMLCLMAQQKPQSFALGRTISIKNDSVSNSSKKQYHHFFPTKSESIINSDVNKSVSNNVVNIVFMDAITNEQISNANPSEYIKDFMDTNPRLEEALNSHYISLHGYGIENNNYLLFLNARSRAMYSKIRGYIIPNKHDIISDELAFDQH